MFGYEVMAGSCYYACLGLGVGITVYAQVNSIDCIDKQLYLSSYDCQNNITSNWTYGSGYGRYGGGSCCDFYSTTGYAIYSSFCSDVEYKSAIKTLDNSLDNLNKLSVVEFEWNDNLPPGDYRYFSENDKLKTFGLIAQEVRNFYPEIVKLNESGYYYIEYPKLNAVLVEAIKEQNVFIDEIQKELNLIKEKIN